MTDGRRLPGRLGLALAVAAAITVTRAQIAASCNHSHEAQSLLRLGVVLAIAGLVLGLGGIVWARRRGTSSPEGLLALLPLSTTPIAVVVATTWQFEYVCRGSPSPVVIAARELAVGETLSDTDAVEIDDPPAALRPTGALSRIEQVVGRVPTERILAGEVIREERLAEPEMGIGLHAVVPRGFEPVRVRADELLLPFEPGQQVDLVATEPVRTVRSVTILQVQEDGELTVAVPSAEVERLTDLGPVTVVLVGDAPGR